MSELEASEIGEAPPPYMIFVVVFLFFMTGLSGFMICHLLKKKGYRCRAGDMEEETEEDEKLGANTEDDDEENQDTVEQILKCIIENEANMEAFNEMLGNKKVCVLHDPRLRKESIGGIPPHHHTVHSGTEPGSCHLCAQGRSKKGRRQSRTPRSKLRPGEQTVFAVGRFRVTHADKKLRGGPNQMAGSGDQLDVSQDSEGERKEGGYNLRSMFKDVKPPSENTNGVPPNPGKRRKSLTIFGLRRGSDPSGIKVKEGTGRDGGAGVRFAIHKQPVVIEEMLQAEDVVESDAKPSIKLEVEPTKKQTQGSGNATSSQSKDQDSRGVPKDSPSPKSRTNLTKPSAVVSTATSSVPNSLPIPSPATSREKAKLEDRLDAYDPGPLQTSTPIAPIHGSIPGFTPTTQSESYSTTPCPVTQTPPGTPDLHQPGFGGADLALISLGSSPQSFHSIKTPSSVSLLKSPTSPGIAITPSPKIGSRYTPSDAAEKSDVSLTPSPRLSSRNSLALTPSPKLPSGRAVASQSLNPSPSPAFGRSPLQLRSPKLDTMRLSPQTPDQIPSFGNSPRLALKSESVTSVSSANKGDIMISSPLTPKEPEPEVARIRAPEAKTEIKPVGILKTAKISPMEGDFKGLAFSSPTDQLSRDSLQVSPSSPMSPSSPIGGRITNVTIVKASPDSKREFSVVTMIDDVESSATNAIKDQKEGTTELGKSEKEVAISPTVGQGGEVPGNQSVEASAAEVGPPVVSQEKDDMVEMEDIKDCKVTEDEDEKL